MAEKSRTYEDRVREREDALRKFESNLAESRLAAAQAKPFNPAQLEEKPIDPRKNKIFMGVGVAILLFFIFSVIYALFSPSPNSGKKATAPSSEDAAQ